MKKKKQRGLSALLEYAGGYRRLTYLSLILSALSSVLALLPFVFLWRIIWEVLEVRPDYSQATGIVRNGWMAVLFAVLAWLVYVAALVCSHGSAFRTAANMKKALLHHIARLPIGFADEMGSGKLRRIVTEVTGSTETLLAHNLPDMAGAIALPLGMLVMLFVYDWRFGLACLIPIALSFAAMMRMAGPAMEEDMRQYQNALERMSSEAVEYVRGVPVVKTFGQTVFSFHRFKSSIDDYCEFCMHYTRMMRKSMLAYTVLIHSAFVDPECEAQVQLAFREMAKGRTVIMIAHRLSTVRNADRIYVLENGCVAEQGKHGALLEQKGLYGEMWAEYQKAARWKVGEAV